MQKIYTTVLAKIYWKILVVTSILWSGCFFKVAEAVGGFVMSTRGINLRHQQSELVMCNGKLFDRIKNDEEFVNAYNTKIDLEVGQKK